MLAARGEPLRIRNESKKLRRERPCGAMHCEWVVPVVLVGYDEPVTGPSTVSRGPSCRRRARLRRDLEDAAAENRDDRNDRIGTGV
jgi:hypothetical protein